MRGSLHHVAAFTRTPKQTGRPSNIDSVIGHTRDGEPITVADRILAALRAGNYVEAAAGSAGITKTTVYEWLKIGAQAGMRTNSGKPGVKVTAHEKRCMAFADAVREAEHGWEVDSNARLQQLAAGGVTTVTETVKVDADGKVLERTTKTEHHAPSAQVLEWRLTRRFPDRYSTRVEVSGPAGEPVPVEVRARSLADALRDFQAGADAQRDVTPAPAQ